MSMDDLEKYQFGRRLLEKQGWTIGKGLGKNESGISEPLKPKLKFDKAGVGHNSADQFTFHWWDHVFNNAAKNLVVKNDENGVTVTQKGDNTDLITTKKKRKGTTKATLSYGTFVRRSVLTDAGEQGEDRDNESSSDDESLSLSGTKRDEMLFKACGGRTAHKGARHGLTLSGKLKRIQEQDDQHYLTDGSSRSSTPVIPTAAETALGKRKPGDEDSAKESWDTHSNQSLEKNGGSFVEVIDESSLVGKSNKDRKKRKKRKREENNIHRSLEGAEERIHVAEEGLEEVCDKNRDHLSLQRKNRNKKGHTKPSQNGELILQNESSIAPALYGNKLVLNKHATATPKKKKKKKSKKLFDAIM